MSVCSLDHQLQYSYTLFHDIALSLKKEDSKVVDDLKRLSFQLTSSEVNIFCLRWTFAIILRVKYSRICDFVYLVDRIIKAKKKTQKDKRCIFGLTSGPK